MLTGTGKAFGTLVKGPKYNRAAYMELLGVLFALFKLAKTKGDLALESHVENPGDSPLFQEFPTFLKDLSPGKRRQCARGCVCVAPRAARR